MHKVFIGLIVSLLLATSSYSIAGQPITKQQAATIARSKFPGRVIAIDERKQDNLAVYHVKVLDKKGGMHTIVIDHQSGNVISAH